MGVVLRRCLAIALAMSGSVWSAALAADMPPWFATSTDAQGLPAVDGFNAKVSSFGGSLDGQATFGGEGSISVPLGYRFGFQLDGLVSGIDSRHHGDVTVAATGAHMFWRDPAVGLLGAYGRYFHADAFSGVNLYIAAAQGALYNGRFTLEGIAGVESGNVALDGFGSRTLDAHFVDVVKLSYYPTDNLKLTVGHSYSLGTHSFLIRAEHGFSIGGGTMAALYARGSVSGDGDASVLAGLRFYFGQRDKTLIRRHREDDPPNYIKTIPIGTPINLLFVGAGLIFIPTVFNP